MGTAKKPTRFDATRQTMVMLKIPRWLATAGVGAWLLLGMAGLVAVVVYLFALVSGLLVPLVAAAVLAAILVPLVDHLQRWHVPRWLGAVLVLLLGIAIAVGTVTLVVQGITDNGDEIVAEAKAAVSRAEQALDTFGIERAEVERFAQSTIDILRDGVVGRALGSVAALLVGVVLAHFFLLFLLKDWDTITSWASGHIGLPRPIGERLITGAVRAFRGYALGLTSIGVVNAVTVAIGLWLIGVPLVGSIAIVTFVTAYVPYLGAFVAGAFAVIIALASGGLTDAFLALAVVVVANNALQNVLEPFAIGRQLRLHPLGVLIVTTAGTLLFGVTGAILAAPVTSVALTALRELREAGTFNDAPTSDEPADAASGKGVR